MEEETRIEDLLSEEIANQIQALSELEIGSEEMSKAVDDVTKLYKLRIEENKSLWDADEKYNRRIMEEEAKKRDDEFRTKELNEKIDKRKSDEIFRQSDNTFRLSELEERVTARVSAESTHIADIDRQEESKKTDNYIRISIAAAELIVPLMFYGIWMNKGFKFEETGTITSLTFKGLIGKFKPTKK